MLMLTTNMIRKDLSSQNMYEAGVALSGLSCFLTADLARDLANEIMVLVRYLIFFIYIWFRFQICLNLKRCMLICEFR